MLFWLAHLLQSHLHLFRVFDYLSFRSIVSALTALLISICTSPKMIRHLKAAQIGQAVRSDGPQSHLKKSGTPTMGGALIIVAIMISMLLWGNLLNRYIWTILLVTIAFATIGWIDDYRKVMLNNSKGLSAKSKFFWQSIIAITAVCFLYFSATTPIETALTLPFLKGIMPQLGVGYLLLGYFVIVGSSNAVNLTDGLDGLALLPTVLVAMALGVFAYLTGNHIFSQYLAIPYIPDVGEVAVFCSALVGAGLGFLWYNTYPAQVFMGDVGSLALRRRPWYYRYCCAPRNRFFSDGRSICYRNSIGDSTSCFV